MRSLKVRGCCFLLNYIYKTILLHNTKLIQLDLTLRQLAIFRLLLTTLYAGEYIGKVDVSFVTF